MRILEIPTAYWSTRIAVGRGASKELGKVSEEAVVIYSESVDPSPALENLRRVSLAISVRDGEASKNVESVLEIVRRIHRACSPELGALVAVGGGTVLDVTGFAASIYRRGLKLVNVPTTLLGMVDAALGGKNGVNLDGVKNLLGTFYQPRLVVSDTSFLETLPRGEISNGSAEMIKYCVTLDRGLCSELERLRDKVFSKDHEALELLIHRSSELKMRIVAEDERETKGVRVVLNYGHTVGHAIESGTGFTTPHGRAVALGMVCEASMAVEMGLSSLEVLEVLERLLELYDLPRRPEDLEAELDLEASVKALARDKKRRGSKILIPVAKAPGAWEPVGIEVEVLERWMRRCFSA